MVIQHYMYKTLQGAPTKNIYHIYKNPDFYLVYYKNSDEEFSNIEKGEKEKNFDDPIVITDTDSMDTEKEDTDTMDTEKEDTEKDDTASIDTEKDESSIEEEWSYVDATGNPILKKN